jgi:MerR family transcriptional regulator, light-induced transcriptional regulator
VQEPAMAADDAALKSEPLLDDAASSLFSAIERYDEDAEQAVLDQALAAFNLEPVLRHLILPTLARVGDAWQENTVAISQEHFASHLIRGRLLALARLWGRGVGPRALLACAPGEEHDITLIACGLLLRSHGWRILFLGADTPLTTLAQAALTVQPELVVVSSFDAALLADNAPALKRLTRRTRLALGGPGAPPALCERLGAECLAADLLVASHAIAA